MSKLQTTLLIIIVAAVTVIALKTYKPTAQETKVDPQRVKGAAEATLKITEFIDFQCPSCAYGSKLLSETIKKYPHLIRLELKYFPLRMHKHAVLASRYAECSLKQNKFWEFHDKVLEQQKNWKILVNAIPAFDSMVSDIGLDQAAFRVCLADPETQKIIDEHKAEGKTLGVRSTPTYFVNGEIIVGAKSLQDTINKHTSVQE